MQFALKRRSTGQTNIGHANYAVPYWLREVIGPLGWSKPIDGDEVGSVLTSGYKSIMGLPTAVTLSFSLVRFTDDMGHTHERSTRKKTRQNSRSNEA